MNRDNRLLEEALKLVSEKKVCMAAKKGCKCSKCFECRKNNKKKKSVKESLNECWDKMSDSQKKKVEHVLQSKSGYKMSENPWNDSKKTVTLTHELGSDAERDIVIDDKGEEVVHTHSGPHHESLTVENKDLIDPNEYSKIINDARQNLHDNKVHGKLAAANFLRGNKEGFATANPHPKDSPASKNWQEGYDEVLAMSDKANTAAVEKGDVPTKIVGTEVKESRLTKTQEQNYLGNTFARILAEAAKKKEHPSSCKCPVCKKEMEKREKYIKDNVSDKKDWPDDMVKEEFEQPAAPATESEVGVDPTEANDYDQAKNEVENVAKQVIECFNSNQGKDWQAELQTQSSSPESAKIHIVCKGKGYNLTVELAKF